MDYQADNSGENENSFNSEYSDEVSVIMDMLDMCVVSKSQQRSEAESTQKIKELQGQLELERRMRHETEEKLTRQLELFAQVRVEYGRLLGILTASGNKRLMSSSGSPSTTEESGENARTTEKIQTLINQLKDPIVSQSGFENPEDLSTLRQVNNHLEHTFAAKTKESQESPINQGHAFDKQKSEKCKLKRFWCVCGYKGTTEKLLKYHVNAANTGTNALWQCSKCEKRFATKAFLNQHQQLGHCGNNSDSNKPSSIRKKQKGKVTNGGGIPASLVAKTGAFSWQVFR